MPQCERELSNLLEIVSEISYECQHINGHAKYRCTNLIHELREFKDILEHCQLYNRK